MPPPRIFLADVSPMTQRKASTRLDLPQPLGPTTPDSPGSITSSAGSTKDLNPETLIEVNCNGGFCSLTLLSQRCDHLVERIEGLGADHLGPIYNKSRRR